MSSTSIPPNEKDHTPVEHGENAEDVQQVNGKLFSRTIEKPAFKSSERHLVFVNYLLAMAAITSTVIGVRAVFVTQDMLTEQQRFDSTQGIRTDSQLAVARETMHRQLRAYVAIDLDAHPDTNAGKGYSLPTIAPFFSIKNVGQTPAEYLRISIHSSIRPVEEESIDTLQPIPYMERVGSRLNPGCTISKYTECPYTPGQFDSIRNGQLILLVWGSIFYDDVFGFHRHTNYRFKSARTRARLLNTLEVCEKGNDAD